jgi:hypothetical protein
MKTLEHLREQAYRAYYNTSFSPEKRAERIVNDYSTELDEDLIEIEKVAPHYTEKYKEKYTQMISHWLRSKSNCISSMITGPANFPIRRAEKANRNEENRYKDFRDWRDKIFLSFQRQAKKKAIEDAGGELEIAKNKLSFLVLRQDYMKRINKAHAAYVKKPNSIIEANLTEDEKDFIIKWVPKASYYTKPFQQFELTNNLSKIKNTEARVKELENKEYLASKENKIFDIPGGRIEFNYKADRIQIFNDQMPSRDVITSYKSHGLRWSPFNKCWQRQITNNAIYSMQLLFKIKF